MDNAVELGSQAALYVRAGLLVQCRIAIIRNACERCDDSGEGADGIVWECLS